MDFNCLHLWNESHERIMDSKTLERKILVNYNQNQVPVSMDDVIS